ncbi:MAG: hypothetical protein KME42_24900 [Tildeniella nuda ZEHNDER 1965/U140]|nr:hypothetical protein [Tildeniella nuda ZEHNDER 1965/U140]
MGSQFTSRSRSHGFGVANVSISVGWVKQRVPTESKWAWAVACSPSYRRVTGWEPIHPRSRSYYFGVANVSISVGRVKQRVPTESKRAWAVAFAHPTDYYKAVDISVVATGVSINGCIKSL